MLRATDQFQRDEHVYPLPKEFTELLKDAIRFVNGTPVYPFPLMKFEGAGVYMIYSTSRRGLYKPLGELNRLEYRIPIYVGKAVPAGWRKGRQEDENATASKLCERLNEHRRNLEKCQGLDLAEFTVRFAIFEGLAGDLISPLESALIREYQPVWNTTVDGFGNHDPGKGRYEQAKSHWDALHPGRSWAEKCKGKTLKRATIVRRLKQHLNGLK